jgi:hypothetical protein
MTVDYQFYRINTVFLTVIALDEIEDIAWLKHKNTLIKRKLRQTEHLVSAYSCKCLDSFLAMHKDCVA